MTIKIIKSKKKKKNKTLVLENFKFKQFGVDLNLEKCKEIAELKIYFILFLMNFPYLQFRILPTIDLKACAKLGLEFEIEKKEDKDIKSDMNLYLDLYLSSEVSVSLEIGLYFPPFPVTGFEMSFSVGLKGVLGSGKIGIKISLALIGHKSVKISIYYQYEALILYAYVLFKIEYRVGFFTFSFKFFLYQKKLSSACFKCRGQGKIK